MIFSTRLSPLEGRERRNVHQLINCYLGYNMLLMLVWFTTAGFLLYVNIFLENGLLNFLSKDFSGLTLGTTGTAMLGMIFLPRVKNYKRKNVLFHLGVMFFNLSNAFRFPSLIFLISRGGMVPSLAGPLSVNSVILINVVGIGVILVVPCCSSKIGERASLFIKFGKSKGIALYEEGTCKTFGYLPNGLLNIAIGLITFIQTLSNKFLSPLIKKRKYVLYASLPSSVLKEFFRCYSDTISISFHEITFPAVDKITALCISGKKELVTEIRYVIKERLMFEEPVYR